MQSHVPEDHPSAEFIEKLEEKCRTLRLYIYDKIAQLVTISGKILATFDMTSEKLANEVEEFAKKHGYKVDPKPRRANY